MGTPRSGAGVEAGVQALTDTPVSKRLFGRRKGRPLRAHKTRLMDELLPQLRIELPGKNFDPRALFISNPHDIWLEIGFGGGEHLAAQAKLHPEIGFLGAEPFVNGIASLLAHIDKDKLANIRIFPDDARALLDALPEASIARCFVLFADPWPKARHAERRFIGPENLPRLARVLRPGGELRLATDDMKLAPWMQEHLAASKDFSPHASPSHQPPGGWVSTRYEQKAIAAGRKPVYMSYTKNPSPA